MSDPRRNERTLERDLLRLALDAGAGSVRDAGHPDENRLALYLSRELPEETAALVERHVAACAECAEVLAFAAVDESASDADAAPRVAAADGQESRPALRVVSSTRSAGAANDVDRAVRGAARRPAEPPREAVARRTSRPGRSRFRAAAAIALFLLAGGVATAGWLALRWAGPVVESKSSDALQRKVSTDGLSFSISGGPGLRLEDLRIADDPRFSEGDFATASRATLQVDPAELLRGRLRGSFAVSDLVLRLVRDADGTWNVETIGGEKLAEGRIDEDEGAGGGGAAAPVAPGTIPPGAGNGRLRLDRANLSNGKLVVVDRGRGTELVVDRLELAADSPDAAKPATVALAGRVGERGKVEVSGTAGPFLRGVPASYDLGEVVLEGVPAHSVPFVPAAVSGDFSFHGRLSSSGKRTKPVLDNLAGRGEVSLSDGRLDGANAARLVLGAIDAHLAQAGAIRPGELLPLVDAAAADDPDLRATLAEGSTAVDRANGPVEIGRKLVGTRDFAVSNGLLDATLTGTVDGDGVLRATGTARLSPALTRAVLAAVPVAAEIGTSEGRLEIPFGAVGAWPALRVAVSPAPAAN